jgi:hypothetical protein
MIMASKLQLSLFSGLLFYVLSNPVTYTVTNSLTGLNLAVNGKPTGMGLLVHTAVYAGVVYLLMCL